MAVEAVVAEAVVAAMVVVVGMKINFKKSILSNYLDWSCSHSIMRSIHSIYSTV